MSALILDLSLALGSMTLLAGAVGQVAHDILTRRARIAEALAWSEDDA